MGGPRNTQWNYYSVLGRYGTNQGGKLASWQRVPGHLYDPYAGIQEDPNQPGTPAYERAQSALMASGLAKKNALTQAFPGGYSSPYGTVAPRGSPQGTYFNPVMKEWQVRGNVQTGAVAHPLFQAPAAATAPMTPIQSWQAAGSPYTAWNGQVNPNAVTNPWTPPKRQVNYMPGHGPPPGYGG